MRGCDTGRAPESRRWRARQAAASARPSRAHTYCRATPRRSVLAAAVRCCHWLLSLAAVVRCRHWLLSLVMTDVRAVIRVASEGVASLRVVASLQTAGASAAPRLRRRLAAVAPVRRFPFGAPVWRFRGSASASGVRFRRVAAGTLTCSSRRLSSARSSALSATTATTTDSRSTVSVVPRSAAPAAPRSGAGPCEGAARLGGHRAGLQCRARNAGDGYGGRL